jgi:hypothetical protein
MYDVSLGTVAIGDARKSRHADGVPATLARRDSVPGLADAVGNAGLNGSAVRVLAVAPLTGFVIGLRGEL